MSITKAPKLGKAVAAFFRNKASKKLLKGASSPTGLQHPVIDRLKIKKSLKARRKTHEDMVDLVDTQYKKQGAKRGTTASKIKKQGSARFSAIHDKYDKATIDTAKYNKNLKRKVIGAGAASIGGITGAHVAAKKKYPGYKRFMERDIKLKEGKLKLVPTKKK